ncbi:MAG: hypothetical protein EXX96DRAFT_630207 [Benjaminiella poitrasii]|nr:MAG: hypothetical protein EXX96DRAFT_630207 [Benjaminiella poitrasii]
METQITFEAHRKSVRILNQKAYQVAKQEGDMRDDNPVQIHIKARQFVNEYLPDMGPARFWPDRLRDNCEKCFIWLFKCSETMETHVSITEPISQGKVSESYIHRRIEEIITITKLRRNFKQALKDNFQRIINEQNMYNEFFVEKVYHRGKDVSYGEKILQDSIVREHIYLVQNAQFKPEKFTDSRGMTRFILVPVYGLRKGHVQFDEQSFIKLLRYSANLLNFGSEQSLLNGSRRLNNIIRTNGYQVECICSDIYGMPIIEESDIMTPIDINIKI